MTVEFVMAEVFVMMEQLHLENVVVLEIIILNNGL